ncbi:MAG: LruC domain-containing protein [Candidatus Cloacimonetes bacterium]|jgi:LruC domain-containing protein|nr:LruC domain-containing protein [Candidatus Cloacimonadota bacterium]MCB5278660.1 LruC domain-containing protein [Candidatus Cloacimonadota bacterium]MDD4232164.1 LruC domain-containing protein [Candidatus Cloacimonadota bacterium]MDY0299651.1 LruC domain-containing protein [Candidatus Cloacimonadaceae bacterium]
MKNILKLVVIAIFMVIAFSACSENENDAYVPIKDITVSPDFNWQTSHQVAVEIELFDNGSAPIKGVVFEIFDSYPEPNSTPLAKGVTLEDGKYNTVMNLPTAVKKVWARGYMGVYEIPINNSSVVLSLGGAIDESVISNDYRKNNSKAWSFLPGLSFNSQGRPYPMNNVSIQADFFERLNATLPESSSLPITHPQYMETSNQVNLKLDETAQVWLTFVHEGAGYLNSLGYYTYPTGNLPTSPSEIESKNIVMPNASLYGSGGQMFAGDTVYLGVFEPGTTMGWFLVANGFRGGYGTNVSTSAPVYYSDPALNPETDPENKKHSVLLFDQISQRFVVGFEDLPRTSESDDDFNDLVFFLTVNPIEAADLSSIPPMDTPIDSDDDGISDAFDDYPDDADLAFNNYTYGADAWGTLAFEDLWPNTGDYDFNDMVVDYNYNQITQPGNRVKKVEMSYKLRGIGARRANGFAVQVPFEASNITQIHASHDALFEMEDDGPFAVMRFFNSAFDLIPQVPNAFINTEMSDTYFEPVDFSVHYKLESPMAISLLETSPPYNPFIFLNGLRSVEVHLPGYPPTTRMATDMLGTQDDASTEGNWYKTAGNLPWAVDIPQSWTYPIEKAQISQAYNKFKDWAQSSGTSYADWYKDLPEYTNPEFMYLKP